MILYEAHGRATGLYTEDEPMKDLAPELRHLCKARVLGLGYGCGPKKFGQVAQALTGGKLNMTDSESRKQVKDFRNQNPKDCRTMEEVRGPHPRGGKADSRMCHDDL